MKDSYYMKDSHYYPVTKDEVLYWYDVLQNNSIKNIANVSGIGREKVRKIINEHNAC